MNYASDSVVCVGLWYVVRILCDATAAMKFAYCLLHLCDFKPSLMPYLSLRLKNLFFLFLVFLVTYKYKEFAFSVLTLLVGRQEGHPAFKKTEWWGAGVVICLERGADLHMVQLMPLPLTVSCFSKIQIGFTFLVPAYPGSPGQRAVKRVCVCVCVCVRACVRACVCVCKYKEDIILFAPSCLCDFAVLHLRQFANTGIIIAVLCVARTYTVFHRKGDTILIAISVSNLNRFSKFFHRLIF